MRQEANRDRNGGDSLLRRAVALPTFRALPSAIAGSRPTRTLVPGLVRPRLTRLRTAAVAIAITIPVSGPVGSALEGTWLLALKIGVIVWTRGFVHPRGQQFKVEQIFRCSWGAHPFSFTPSEGEVKCSWVAFGLKLIDKTANSFTCHPCREY
jgi:hypothetical protein